MPTEISWTDETWNPVTGCSHVSPGCEFCYAEKLSHRFRRTTKPWGAQYAAENVVLHPGRLEMPLRWKKPRRVFVNSMSDLFHEQVPDEFIAEVFDVMARCGPCFRSEPHTFQILTKRPERMREWVTRISDTPHGQPKLPGGYGVFAVETWPLPNVWLGVSAEDQERADERIPILLQTPAAVRFVSCEPLLGPIDLRRFLAVSCSACGASATEVKWARLESGWANGHVVGGSPPDVCGPMVRDDAQAGLSWVIVGGESGGPPERRLVSRENPDDGDPATWEPKPGALRYVHSLRDQCQAAGVPFYFKQWGGPTHASGGRLLDGREWNEFPGGTA